MTKNWQSFLLNSGAEFSAEESGTVAHFGNPDQELALVNNGMTFCDLSQYALIQVSGEDASAFLQGQLSNDIALLADNGSQLSAYCSPKGRVITLMRIVKNTDNTILILPRPLLDKIIKRLRMFIMMSKVDVKPIEEMLLIGIAGPKAEEAVNKITGQTIATINETIHSNGSTFIRLQGSIARYLLIRSADTMQSVWDDLNVDATPVGEMPWRYLDIVAGLPNISLETSESQVPQMLNLDLLEAVNFQKGCYPGQEVVARMHYLGKLKKRMYTIEIDSSIAPSAGSDLSSPAGRADESIGTIIQSARHPGGHVCALAVLQKKIVDANATITLKGSDTKVMHVSAPTYPSETDIEF